MAINWGNPKDSDAQKLANFQKWLDEDRRAWHYLTDEQKQGMFDQVVKERDEARQEMFDMREELARLRELLNEPVLRDRR